jgi:hypothetical protein
MAKRKNRKVEKGQRKIAESDNRHTNGNHNDQFGDCSHTTIMKRK